MKYAILYSKKDEAGINIAEQLKNHFLPQASIIELAKESIYNEHIDENLDELKNVEFIIFATKHQSKSGEKSLSLHAPGNWRSADFGGKIGKVCSTSSLALKFLFQKLEENAKSAGYPHNITLEVTHHGPLIEKVPCCFIELGSSLEGWKDKNGAEIVAKTIADFQNFRPDNKIKSAIAIGGPHYCPNFNKIQLNTKDIAISHIIPEHALPLSENMLKEAIGKTKEHTKLVLIDWKGCGNSESRQKVIDLVEKSGLDWKGTDKIEK